MTGQFIWDPAQAPCDPHRPSGVVIADHTVSDIENIYTNTPSEMPWIAPELEELLFDKDMNTFFLVDANLRADVIGYFDLDTLDVPSRCLFTGVAGERYKEVAPHLLDITLPPEAWADRSAISIFHRTFFKRHWRRGTGIFLRTPATMDTAFSNFRKLTKVRTSTGKVTFFRFWDATILTYFLAASSDTELDRIFVTQSDVFVTIRPAPILGGVSIKSARRGLVE